MSKTRTRTHRLDSVAPGSVITLLYLDGSEAMERTLFLGIEGEGDDREARFLSRSGSGDFYHWEAYRFNGRWVYGTSADRLQIIDVESAKLGEIL